MDIAFTSERSIQDGIEEISTAEVGTVLVSYLIMFLYVALALGKIKSFGKALVRIPLQLMLTTIAIALTLFSHYTGEFKNYVGDWRNIHCICIGD